MSSFTNDFHHHLPSSSDQHRRLSVNNGIHIRQPVSAITSTSNVVAGQLAFRFPTSSAADSPSSLPRSVIASTDPTSFPSSLDVDAPIRMVAPSRSSGRGLPYQFSFTAQPTTATTQPPRNQSLTSDFTQFINTSPLQHIGANTFPFPPSSSSSSNNVINASSNANYHLGTPRSTASTSSSSFGTTPSSFTSDSFSAASPTHHHGTDAVADAYPSYAQSLPASNALQSSSITSPVSMSAIPVSWAGPSSAPPVPTPWDTYISTDEVLGSPGMAGFSAGMSTLWIDNNVKRHDSMGTISPRDVVLTGSGTVIDHDDFSNAGSPTTAGVRDYPAVGGFGGQRSNGMFSSSYPGYSSDYPLDLPLNNVSSSPLMFNGYSANLFGVNSPQFSTTLPPNQQQSPGMDMATQFNLELDGDFAKASLIDANKTPHMLSTSFDASSPTQTIRAPRKSRSDRPELAVAIDSALSVKFESGNTPTIPWSIPSRPSRKTNKLMEEDAIDEDEDDDDEDDNNDDDDYVDEPHHHGAGPHRTARRMSSSAATPTTPTSNTKPRRPSPYSRSSRPSSTNVRRLSHPSSEKDRPAPATLAPKKVKSVKWESTKPKYWIPEGFDPYWDQKSRGRGVATVSTSAPSSFDAADAFVNDGTFVDSSAAWPLNYLPDDWRELVRGKGNPSRPFVCPAVNCGKTFQRSEHAKRHAWSLHTPDAVKVSCPFEGCDHKSTRGDNLKQHIGSHKRKSGGAAALRRRSEGGATGARRKVKYEEDGDDDEINQWA
ncbi:hypothetical protein FRB90_007567 [Tulasnella sp. 427]|nr:hypothetical protein FRB90_007567 [Tulasnella sp. 427]